MEEKVVIAGSASLQEEVQYWKKLWEENGCVVLNYPSPISRENFLEEYPKVHADFFKDITKANILFVMNEDKNNVIGYIGAESFAELCFGVAQNIVYGKNIKVILLKMPDKNVQSYEEIVLWLKLGWIELYS